MRYLAALRPERPEYSTEALLGQIGAIPATGERFRWPLFHGLQADAQGALQDLVERLAAHPDMAYVWSKVAATASDTELARGSPPADPELVTWSRYSDFLMRCRVGYLGRAGGLGPKLVDAPRGDIEQWRY